MLKISNNSNPQLNAKNSYFKTLQYNLITQFSSIWLPARVDMGAMVMKVYSAFPKALALLEPHHQTSKSYPGHSLREYTPQQICSLCILQPELPGPRLPEAQVFKHYSLTNWQILFSVIPAAVSPVKQIETSVWGFRSA